MTRSWYTGLALAALASALLLTAACKDANNNTTTATTAAASPTAAVAAATAAPTTAPEASPAAAGASNAPQEVTEVTTDDKFSVTQINTKVGQPLKITVQNKGQAIHNWALSDAAGKAAATGTTAEPLVQPGQTDSITLTFTKAGTFNFQCQVHPTEMTGKVTVTQ